MLIVFYLNDTELYKSIQTGSPGLTGTLCKDESIGRVLSDRQGIQGHLTEGPTKIDGHTSQFERIRYLT